MLYNANKPILAYLASDNMFIYNKKLMPLCDIQTDKISYHTRWTFGIKNYEGMWNNLPEICAHSTHAFTLGVSLSYSRYTLGG
jgi:hypothetical protein